MGKPGVVEGFADHAHAAVHHVRRCHEVGAGAGLHQGLLGEHSHRGVVQDLAVFDQAIVALGRIRVQCHRR